MSESRTHAWRNGDSLWSVAALYASASDESSPYLLMQWIKGVNPEITRRVYGWLTVKPGTAITIPLRY